VSSAAPPLSNGSHSSRERAVACSQGESAARPAAAVVETFSSLDRVIANSSNWLVSATKFAFRLSLWAATAAWLSATQ
jgi:hypothetical protein